VTQDCHKALKARLLVVTIVKAVALPLWSRLRCPHESIEKCLATDQIVIDTVVSKYCDHQPLYRHRAQCWSGTAVGTQPGDAGGLGPESGRVADSHGLGDETGIMLPPRMRTTSWDLGQPSSTTNGLSTTRNGMGHLCSAIGWSLSSAD
jgi:hypothetical protein